jgi:hypothetical protein
MCFLLIFGSLAVPGQKSGTPAFRHFISPKANTEIMYYDMRIERFKSAVDFLEVFLLQVTISRDPFLYLQDDR